MLIVRCPIRGTDKHGSGHWGASRGRRKHKGVDPAAYAGSVVYSPVIGVVTKLGYPYADDLSYRYVEITDAGGDKHRLFYITPLVVMGEKVTPMREVGIVQDITTRHPGITNHIHYEIKRGPKFIEPVTF